MAPQRFNHLPIHLQDAEDFSMLYPDPPQGPFPSTPLGMNIPPDSYYSRPGHEYPTTTTSMAYDARVLYAEAQFGGLFGNNDRSAAAAHAAGMPSPGLFPDDGDIRLPSSNLSTASIGSASPSAHGSPRSVHGQPQAVPEWAAAGPHSGGVSPGIASQGDYLPTAGTEYSPFATGQGLPGMEEFVALEFAQHTKAPGFVDPSLIHPGMDRPMGIPFDSAYPPPPPNNNNYPASPAMSSPQMRSGNTSPFNPTSNYHQYSSFPAPLETRRQSIHSYHSANSAYSTEQPYHSGGESDKEKQRCPHPDCGRVFKDLKAHMLTHQPERPEKCPIVTCDYHHKGFARKYDKNRHTLTHYKGNMVCGFCPGSGSAAEKSFNRADVFKRHLMAVHGVEQSPPNSRKKMAAAALGKKLTGYAPDATGKCSTCSATFNNAQDFYEHLDDCVLRIVQQEDPAEAINAQRLAEVEEDKDVHATLEKNQLPTATMTSATDDEMDEDMDDEDADEDDNTPGGVGKSSSPTIGGRKKGSNPANGVQKSRGMTHSRGGVPLVAKSRRKNRRDYPTSWGFDKGHMTMKKRVVTAFDGARRLAKDDMMLSTEHEVRVRLADGRSYVTDLDVQTMRRAEGFHSATEAEKGPWVSDDPTEEQLAQMRAASRQ